MDKTTKLKEAFKIALAFAIVYGIALKVNWLSPSWAGWSVVAIASLSGGQSLQRGLLRIWGTLLACAIGIAIISLGAQNRWVFMFLTALWLFFCTYRMLADKKITYFWFVAGYVCLVITAAGPSPVGGFYIALYRTIETILGIVVYTTVAVFLWPLSNEGAIKKSLRALLNTQSKLIQGAEGILGSGVPIDQFKELRQKQVEQLGQFHKSLSAEGAENYQVQENKALWNKLEHLSSTFLKTIETLFAGIEDLSDFDRQGDWSEVDHFFGELSKRFEILTGLLSGKSPENEVLDVKISMASFSGKDISHLDKAALSIIVHELHEMEKISRAMVETGMEIADFQLSSKKSNSGFAENQNKKGKTIPVIDIEYLKSSVFVAAAVLFGFLLWFYVNPPGHASWYIMGGVFALIFAGAPQVKTVKLIIPFLVAMFLAALIYLLILPRLDGFFGLGILLFTCMFFIQYKFAGPAAPIFTIAFLQLVVITNPQQYDLSGLINSFVFISLFIIYLFSLSYIISSPRPEKVFLKLNSRFFRAARYLVSPKADDAVKSSTFLLRYERGFYMHELQSLPAKIKAWGKAIDKDLYANTDHQQIEKMVSTLEVLIVRIEALITAARSGKDSKINAELAGILADWGQRLEEAFVAWDHLPAEVMESNSNELVLERINLLEQKLNDWVARSGQEITEEEGIQFYQLLGGYRGVTEGALAFVKIAEKLDWEQWKEERFQ